MVDPRHESVFEAQLRAQPEAAAEREKEILKVAFDSMQATLATRQERAREDHARKVREQVLADTTIDDVTRLTQINAIHTHGLTEDARTASRNNLRKLNEISETLSEHSVFLFDGLRVRAAPETPELPAVQAVYVDQAVLYPRDTRDSGFFTFSQLPALPIGYDAALNLSVVSDPKSAQQHATNEVVDTPTIYAGKEAIIAYVSEVINAEVQQITDTDKFTTHGSAFHTILTSAYMYNRKGLYKTLVTLPGADTVIERIGANYIQTHITHLADQYYVGYPERNSGRPTLPNRIESMKSNVERQLDERPEIKMVYGVKPEDILKPVLQGYMAELVQRREELTEPYNEELARAKQLEKSLKR